jgi:hypothetical protein
MKFATLAGALAAGALFASGLAVSAASAADGK